MKMPNTNMGDLKWKTEWLNKILLPDCFRIGGYESVLESKPISLRGPLPWRLVIGAATKALML
jgi:hypothetical protein